MLLMMLTIMICSRFKIYNIIENYTFCAMQSSRSHTISGPRMVDFIQHKLAKCTQRRDAWAVGNSETLRGAGPRWEHVGNDDVKCGLGGV